MSDKPAQPDLRKASICLEGRLKPWNRIMPAILKRRPAWLPLLLWLAASSGLPRYASSQINKDLGQGAPLNFTKVDSFTTNLSKQTLTFLRLPGISPDYRLGARDVLKINVVGNAFLEQSCQISSSGEISFPLLGTLRVEGLTAEELELEIARRLKERQLLKNPEVLVYIDSYEAKPFYVLGIVDYPGEYRMSQELTVMDAIFLAGGLDFLAARYGYLHRRSKNASAKPRAGAMPAAGKPGPRFRDDRGVLFNPEKAPPGTEVIKIDLQPMKEGGVLTPNIRLQAGDVLIIPKRNAEFFYVVGDVLYAGAFEMPEGARVKASQALSWAGGPAKTARMSKGILVRYDEKGNRQELKIDYAAILRGRQPDFAISPNDILFIPGSKTKTLAYGALGILPSTFQNTVRQ